MTFYKSIKIILAKMKNKYHFFGHIEFHLIRTFRMKLRMKLETFDLCKIFYKKKRVFFPRKWRPRSY